MSCHKNVFDSGQKKSSIVISKIDCDSKVAVETCKWGTQGKPRTKKKRFCLVVLWLLKWLWTCFFSRMKCISLITRRSIVPLHYTNTLQWGMYLSWLWAIESYSPLIRVFDWSTTDKHVVSHWLCSRLSVDSITLEGLVTHPLVTIMTYWFGSL